jgi:spore maturation protein SpmB
METLIARCGGLDTHQAIVVASLLIYLVRGKVKKIVRTFGTATRELRALRNWLH